MHRAIVAVNWNDRLQIRGRSLVGGSAHLRSLSSSCPPPDRTCVSRDTQVHAIGIRYFHQCTSVDRWSRWRHQRANLRSLAVATQKKRGKSTVQSELQAVQQTLIECLRCNARRKTDPTWTSILSGFITELYFVYFLIQDNYFDRVVNNYWRTIKLNPPFNFGSNKFIVKIYFNNSEIY